MMLNLKFSAGPRSPSEPSKGPCNLQEKYQSLWELTLSMPYRKSLIPSSLPTIYIYVFQRVNMDTPQFRFVSLEFFGENRCIFRLSVEVHFQVPTSFPATLAIHRDGSGAKGYSDCDRLALDQNVQL